MRQFASVVGLFTILLYSCATNEKDIMDSSHADVTFFASFEQPEDADTRVYANEKLQLRWTADDRVSIFNRNTYNQQYRFTGNTGDNSGSFKKVDSDDFVTGNAISQVVSVYPYLEETRITDDGILSITLPDVQKYSENTFGLGANTMVSVSDDNLLMYKNVGGYLKLRLYGNDVSVKSISLKGNLGEKLAGQSTVTMVQNGAPTVQMSDGASTEITLLCESPVELGTTVDHATDFWFVLPPVIFDEGFTISVEETTGGIFRKTTTNTISVERNRVSKMAPVEVEKKYLANKFYYTTLDESVISFRNGYPFDVPIVSNEYVDGRGIITFDGNVTRIGSSFHSCIGRDGILTIMLPESVEVIEAGAFEYLYGLTSVTLNDGLKEIGGHAFDSCIGLTEINFPEGLLSIGSSAFEGCYKLATATLSEGLISIGEQAFYNCTGLRNVALPNSLTTIGELAFYNCNSLPSICLPDGLISLGNSAFSGCSSLSNCIILPKGLKSVPYYLFASCSKIPSIILPNGLETICEGAFSGCTSLADIVFSDSLKSIGHSAFSNCWGLTEITLPEGLTTIDDYAFYKCENLTHINIPDSVTRIGSHSFYNNFHLEDVTIPTGITQIEEYAFAHCNNLKHVSLPEGLTEIGPYAFWNTGLVEITFPNSLNRIEHDAFNSCYDLKSLAFPANVESIGYQAFYYCTKVTSVTSLSIVPPSIGETTFIDIPRSTPLYVPASSIDVYGESEWGSHFDIIQALQE